MSDELISTRWFTIRIVEGSEGSLRIGSRTWQFSDRQFVIVGCLVVGLVLYLASR